MSGKRTPRRAVILAKNVTTASQGGSVQILVAPWEKEVEAVDAALRGEDALRAFMATGAVIRVTLNHSALMLLELCDGVTTVEEIEQTVQKRYGLCAGEAAEAVSDGLQSLADSSLVRLNWSPL